MPFSSQAVLRSASESEGRAANEASECFGNVELRSWEIRINQSANHEPHHIITISGQLPYSRDSG
jgi:hypothetical protein